MADDDVVYSEHIKLKAIQAESQAVGEFIEWLGQNGMTICQFVRDEYQPIRETRIKLLARAFNIDLVKIDAEKEAMLNLLRSRNS